METNAAEDDYESDNDVAGIRLFGVNELRHKERKQDIANALSHAKTLRAAKVKELIGNNRTSEAPYYILQKYISQLTALRNRYNIQEKVRKDKSDFDFHINQLEDWYIKVVNAFPLRTTEIDYMDPSGGQPPARRNRKRNSTATA